MNISIPKKYVRFALWIVLYAIIIFCIRSYNGMGTGFIGGGSLVMTQAEADGTSSAVDYVLSAIDQKSVTTTEGVIEALLAEVPESVKGKVKDYMGNPSFDTVPNKLKKMVSSIKITQ